MTNAIDDSFACVQESTALKDEWLVRVKHEFPVGARVRVVDSDVSFYIGSFGTVADYDPGNRGDYPMIGVVFDIPINRSCATSPGGWQLGPIQRDGFYAEELELIALPYASRHSAWCPEED